MTDFREGISDAMEAQRRIVEVIEPALQVQEKYRSMIEEAVGMLPKLHSLKNECPGIIKDISIGSVTIEDSFLQLESQVQSALSWWRDSRAELEKQAQEIQKSLEYAERKLLSAQTPLKIWGKYGWSVSPHALIRDYYTIPESKQDADRIMKRIHNSSAADAVIQSLRKSTFHSGEDIDEVIKLFNGRYYKSCALFLFSLIDSLLIHTQDETVFANNRKQGNDGVKRFKKLAEPDISDRLTQKLLCFISSTEALDAFFDSTENFENTNPVLNRHLLAHGMNPREVTRTDCKQLFLLYYNMLICVGQCK